MSAPPPKNGPLIFQITLLRWKFPKLHYYGEIYFTTVTIKHTISTKIIDFWKINYPTTVEISKITLLEWNLPYNGDDEREHFVIQDCRKVDDKAILHIKSNSTTQERHSNIPVYNTTIPLRLNFPYRWASGSEFTLLT